VTVVLVQDFFVGSPTLSIHFCVHHTYSQQFQQFVAMPWSSWRGSSGKGSSDSKQKESDEADGAAAERRATAPARPAAQQQAGQAAAEGRPSLEGASRISSRSNSVKVVVSSSNRRKSVPYVRKLGDPNPDRLPQLTPEKMRSLEAKRRAAAKLQLDTMDNYIQSYRGMVEFGIADSEKAYRLVLGLAKAAEQQQEFILDLQQQQVGLSSFAAPLRTMENMDAWNQQTYKLQVLSNKILKAKRDLEKQFQELDRQGNVLKSMKSAEASIGKAWDAYSAILSQHEDADYRRRMSRIPSSTSDFSDSRNDSRLSFSASMSNTSFSASDSNLPPANNDDGSTGGDGSVSSLSQNSDAWLAELKYRKAVVMCQSGDKWDSRTAEITDSLKACLNAEVRRRVQLRDAMIVTTQVSGQVFADLDQAQITTQEDLERKEEVTRAEVEKEVEEAILARLEKLERKKKKTSVSSRNQSNNANEGNDNHEGPPKESESTVVTPANVDGEVAAFYSDMFAALEENAEHQKKVEEVMTSSSDRTKTATFYTDVFSTKSPLDSDFFVHAALVEILATADLALAVVTKSGLLHIFIIPSLASLQDPVESAMKQLLAASSSANTGKNASKDDDNEDQHASSSLDDPWKSLALEDLKVSSEKGHQVLELLPDEEKPDTKLSVRASSDEARAALVKAIEQEQKKRRLLKMPNPPG